MSEVFEDPIKTFYEAYAHLNSVKIGKDSGGGPVLLMPPSMVGVFIKLT